MEPPQRVAARPDRRVPPGVVGLALIAVLAVGVVVLRAGDEAPLVAARATGGPKSSTTAAPAPAEPRYTGVISIGEEGMAAAELALISAGDPERGDDDEVVLVSMDGTEHGRGPRNDWYTNNPERGVGFRFREGGVILTEAPALDGPVPGCGAVHGAGGVRAAVCGRIRDEIRLIDMYGQERVLTGPVAEEGHWRFALPSPDGTWLLAQWSGECEAAQAYLVEVSGVEQPPVAAVGAASTAIGWSPDNRAVVAVPDGGCGERPGEPGTYLVDPEPYDRQRIHHLPAATRLTDYYETGNRLERVMVRAHSELGLEECCAQPSHGGGDAENGTVFEGHHVGIHAVPLDELPPSEEDRSAELSFTCGSDRYFLADYGPPGSGEEAAPDWALLERAAQRLVPGLYCTLGSGADRSRPPMREDMLLVYLHHGSIWAVGVSGERYRLTQGPGDSGPVAAPDRAGVAFGRLNYEGVFDSMVALDVHKPREATIGIAGVGAFSSDGQLAVGEPVDDDLAETEVVVREPGSWEETARIALGPQREVGSVVDLAWDTDNRSLLAVLAHSRLAGRPSGTSLWSIDTAAGSAEPIPVRGARQDDEWIVGPAGADGVFPAIRKLGAEVTWGELRVSSDRARFESWGLLPHQANGTRLDPASVAYLSPVGRVQVRRISDATFTFEPGLEEAFLVGDGRSLFLLSRSGRLAHLLSDVVMASSPPTTDGARR